MEHESGRAPGVQSKVAQIQDYAPLKFSGKGSDIFSKNGLIALVSLVSVVGIPIFAVYFYRWMAGKTTTTHGKTFSFTGSISTAYALTLLSIVVQLLQSHLPLAEFYAIFSGNNFLLWLVIALVTLFFYALHGVVAYLQFCYFYDNVKVDNGASALNSVAPWLKFVGISVVGGLSFFTVVGWAWWYAWAMRWAARHIACPSYRFRFVGTGLQLLWRLPTAMIASVPIFTSPWAFAWLYRWLVSSIEAAELSPSADSQS
jgi:hypothetical protein